MKKIRFILFLLFAAFFLSLPVYADTLSFDIATGFSDNLLQINGKSAPGDLISVEIVPAESNTARLWEGISSSRKKKISDSVSVASDAKALTYADFVTADSNGDFSLAASISIDSVISENWEYKILIYSKADKKLYEKNFYFADKETYAILVDEYLNPNVVNKNFDDFKNNITEYRNLMGFNDEKYSDVSYDEIIKQLYNYLLGSGTLLSNDNSGYNDNLYETCAIITALNNGIHVSSNGVAEGDLNFYRSFGIEPAQYDLVCVKACTSFRAGYEPVAAEICNTDTPGSANSCLIELPFTKLPEIMYPFTEISAENISEPKRYR